MFLAIGMVACFCALDQVVESKMVRFKNRLQNNTAQFLKGSVRPDITVVLGEMLDQTRFVDRLVGRRRLSVPYHEDTEIWDSLFLSGTAQFSVSLLSEERMPNK